MARAILIGLLAVFAVCVVGILWYAHEFDSRIAANESTPGALSQVLTPAKAGEPYYVLVLGSDWREYSGTNRHESMQGDNQRSDVIILTRIDAANNQVTMVSVPRDTRWEHDGQTLKINEAYNIGGAALETQAVSELTGVPISHVIEVHFSGFEGLVDALGGIKVTVPQSIEYWDALTGEYIRVEEGSQTLDGQQAQIFARVRSAYEDGEATRQSNVRQIAQAIASGIRSKPFFEWPSLGLRAAECLGSDLRFFDLIGIVLGFSDGKVTVYSGTGPTLGDIDDNAGGLWLCYPNPEGWQRVMDAANSGGDPASVDPNLETESFSG